MKPDIDAATRVVRNGEVIKLIEEALKQKVSWPFSVLSFSLEEFEIPSAQPTPSLTRASLHVLPKPEKVIVKEKSDDKSMSLLLGIGVYNFSFALVPLSLCSNIIRGWPRNWFPCFTLGSQGKKLMQASPNRR